MDFIIARAADHPPRKYILDISGNTFLVPGERQTTPYSELLARHRPYGNLQAKEMSKYPYNSRDMGDMKQALAKQGTPYHAIETRLKYSSDIAERFA